MNSAPLSGCPKKTDAYGTLVFETVKLKEIGITGHESADAQFLAKISEKTFQAIKHFEMNRTEAKRKLGEMLIEMWPKMAKGGRPKKTGSLGEPVLDAVQLKEIGITAKESSPKLQRPDPATR